MERREEQLHILLQGLTCPACERKVSKTLTDLPGVVQAVVSYTDCTADVVYLPEQVSKQQINDAIRQAGYDVLTREQAQSSRYNLILLGLIAAGLFVIINNTVGFDFFPQITAGMGYGMLFVVGVLTSLHCVAMCGGIALSQCAGCQGSGIYTQLRPGLLYNLGRVVSYSLLGGLVGLAGSVLGISPRIKGGIYLFAGVFMVFMGLNMLGHFSMIRRLTPRLPAGLAHLAQSGSGRHPFVVGLLNGLMPCGPLQSMQLYALGTGSFISGALSMFLFSVGTVPLMLGFTTASALVGTRFQKQVMHASAALILVMGIAMGGRGLSVAGIDPAAGILVAVGLDSAQNEKAVTAMQQNGFQAVTTQLEPGEYREIVVKQGIPVKWSIVAQEGTLNGCNNEILIPGYGIEKKLQLGENLIEFTPQKTGTVVYTCWMGMITSRIIVV